MSFLQKIHKLFSNRYFQVGLIFMVLILVRFAPIFLSNRTIFFGDNYSLMVPGKLFTALWLRQGILALWNPTIFAGLPWIGDVNQSVLYPTSLLFTFLHPAHAVNFTLMFHLGITFVGAYVLTYSLNKSHWSSLIAAVIWSFSTQLTGALHNISSIQSIIWLPWIVFAGLKVYQKGKKTLAAQLGFALLIMIHFLGGYPQHVVFSIFLAVAFSFFMTFWGLDSVGNTQSLAEAIKESKKQKTQKSSGKKKKKRDWSELKPWFIAWLSAGILSIGLTAFIWLPFVEVLQDSTRITQSQDQSTSGSLHPVDMAKFVLPYAFDKPADGMKWGPKWNAMPNLAFYITWLGLLLPIWVFIKRRTEKIDIFLLIMTLATIAFAMGEYLPGYEVLQMIPIFKFSRGPSTILMLTNLVLAVWVGLIIARHAKKSLFTKQDFKILLSLGVAVGIVSVGIWAFVHYQFNQFWLLLNQVTRNAFINSAFHTVAKDTVIFRIITQNMLVNSVFFMIALGLLYKKRLTLLFIVIAIDMIYNTSGNLFFAPNNVYMSLDDSRQEQLLREFPQLKDPQHRTLVRNYNAPYSDFGAYFEALTVRAPFSDSYIGPTELDGYDALKRYAIGFTPDWNMPQNLRILNGYTTMIPQDMDDTWNNPTKKTIEQALATDGEIIVTSDADNYTVSINDLPEIKTTDPTLQPWATKYYFVDTWFDSAEDYSHMSKVAEFSSWQLYELPDTLARFRYEDDSPVEPLPLYEETNKKYVSPYGLGFDHPNIITLKLDNTDEHTHLIVADRYDKNWQAMVNGEEVEIENHQNMRKIELTTGENMVELRYVPEKFYKGLMISGLVLGVALVMLWVQKRFPKSEEK